MKMPKLLSRILLALAVLFLSCSKEDEALMVPDDKAYLSFKTLLNDFNQNRQNKQVIPGNLVCIQRVPVFVEIILSYGDIYVAGSAKTPHRLNLIAKTPGTNGKGIPDYFTEDSAIMELFAGTYTLEYFTVLDAEENIIWIAPMKDNRSGGIDEVVSRSLPMEINLKAGVRQNQDVEVICFDDRNVNEYGYLNFGLNGIQVIEFCTFGNYCDVNGRHAEFMLFAMDVWKFSGNAWSPKGLLLHEDLQNEVVVSDYEDYAETQSFPLCFTLPDGPGVDEYYIEINQINLGAEDVLIRSGLISDVDVRNLFRENGAMEYFHFTEGNCNIPDEPVLLNDPRDIIGAWEFDLVFGEDAIVDADVVFYPNGTASYRDFWTTDEPLWGTWAYFNDTLFYDPDGEEDFHGYYDMSGTLNDGRLTGTFWQDGFPGEWEASKKD